MTSAIDLIIEFLKSTGKVSDLALWRNLDIRGRYETIKHLSSWYWTTHRNCKDTIKYSLEGRPNWGSKYIEKHFCEPGYGLTEDFKCYCNKVLSIVVSNIIANHGIQQDLNVISSDEWIDAATHCMYIVKEW